MHTSAADRAVLEEELECFWMARLNEVLVMLQYQLDFAVGQCSVADEGDDCLGYGDLAQVNDMESTYRPLLYTFDRRFNTLESSN